MLDCNRVKNELMSWFPENHLGYWITLNSRMRAKHFGDATIPTKFHRFSPSLFTFADQLNEFCYGRRFLRKEPGARLKIFSSLEVGSLDGIIHAHLICVHDGPCARSIEAVGEKTKKISKKMPNMSASESSCNVAELNSLEGRVRYALKQVHIFERFFQEVFTQVL